MQATAGPDDAARVAPPAEPVEVRLLGELDVRAGGLQLPPLESGRARSLLGYVVLHPEEPHSRQHLAFALWPDSSEPQARTNLRKVLHTLRHGWSALDAALEVTPRTVRWRPDVPLWTDVAAFEAALDRVTTGTDADEVLAALRQAVALYRSDLLPGCYDEWLVAAREQLRDRYLVALRRLVGLLADRGDGQEAIRLGHELLRRDPLREDTYRLLMAIHDAAGDRAGAVRVFHDCVNTLRRELGVEPSAATSAAHAAIVAADGSEDPAGILDRLPLEPSPLVGRDLEWRRLTARWLEAERGTPGAVLVTGEAGVGKSRLVDELASWCAHRGAVVAEARAYPTGGDLGYGALVAWLRRPELQAAVRSAPPADRVVLRRLLPELEAGDGDVHLAGFDEAHQRQRIFDAALGVLAARERPTLLVLEDAQWCDVQSLALVHHLMRAAPDRPLLVVVTARREDLDDDDPLVTLAAALTAIGRLFEIPLERLGREDTERLARNLGLETDLGWDVFAETEGNPLFVVETVRAIHEGGESGTTLTPRLHAVIDTRLHRCSATARQVLGLAATIGRPFTARLVHEATALDDTLLVRALDELWRRGLIREHGTDGYDLSHRRIGDVAYDELSPPARRRNHLLVAEALVRVHTDDADAVSGHVAGSGVR